MQILITSQIRAYADRVLADEEKTPENGSGVVPAAFRVCENLRRPLTTLAGAAGFHSLLSRALILTKREAPGLKDLRVNSVGSLEGFESTLDTFDVAEGALLVTNVIGLLQTFVGETLTLRLLQDIWPDGSFNTPITEGTGPHDPGE